MSMSDIQEKDDAAQDISGLALALLLGESFIELLGFCEDENDPVGKIELRQSFPVKKPVLRFVNKWVRLGRF